VRTQGDRHPADRVLTPEAGPVLRIEPAVHGRLVVVGAVVGASGEDRRRRCLAERDPGLLTGAVRDFREILGEQLVAVVGLRRKDFDQRVVRGLRDRRFHRRAGRRVGQPRVALVVAGDRVHRVEDGDLNDGDGPAGATGTELLAERALLAGGDRRVIQPAGVDRDLVPMVQPPHRAAVAVKRRELLSFPAVPIVLPRVILAPGLVFGDIRLLLRGGQREAGTQCRGCHRHGGDGRLDLHRVPPGLTRSAAWARQSGLGEAGFEWLRAHSAGAGAPQERAHR
jgi:hypothetical protein